MKKATKTKRALDFLAQYVAQNNPTVTEKEIKEAVETAPTSQDAISLQGEAVLLYIEKPARFTMKKCKWCGEVFGTNYRYVSYCSNSHRAKGFQRETGISWDWYRSEEDAWGGERPLIIPPQALKRLVHFSELVLYYHQLVQNQNGTRPVGRIEAGKQFLPEELSHLIDLAREEAEGRQKIEASESDEESHQSKDVPQTIPVESPPSLEHLLPLEVENPFDF